MREITDAQLEIVSQRIKEHYSAEVVAAEVFTTPETQRLFVDGLCQLAARGAVIKAGGRRLRELLGCEVFDMSKFIRWEAQTMLKDRIAPHDAIRIWPLLRILEKYPQERMEKPDLDLFIWNADSQQIINVFQDLGFDVTLHEATGGVWVVNVEGDNGTATFVDGSQSWQTGEAWPMFGFNAVFRTEPTPSFDLDISAARLHVYPLEIPLVSHLDALNPKRVAAIGRALLWQVTVSLPGGNLLAAPWESSQRLFLETISKLPELLERIEQDPSLERLYRSGLRDLALALRIIVLEDWSYLSKYGRLSKDHYDFFNMISAFWVGSYFEPLLPDDEELMEES